MTNMGRFPNKEKQNPPNVKNEKTLPIYMPSSVKCFKTITLFDFSVKGEKM